MFLITRFIKYLTTTPPIRVIVTDEAGYPMVMVLKAEVCDASN
jgi:hypothetical protein